MARHLDLVLLRTFVAVAEHASMTAAAGALHITQGAVSQRIKRLEDQLGAPVFELGRRGLRLAPPGERLLGHARRLLALNDELWADLTQARLDGAVRLGAPPDLAGCLAPVLKRYVEAYPFVDVSLACGSSPGLKEALRRGETDLAVIEEPLGIVAGECLCVERLVWAGARGGSAHLKDPLPISMVADTCAFRPAVVAALHAHGRAWRTLFESGSVEATAATVQSDLAITASLAFTVPPGLDILPPGAGLPELPPFALSLHLSGRKPGAATAALAQHLRTALTRQVGRPE